MGLRGRVSLGAERDGADELDELKPLMLRLKLKAPASAKMDHSKSSGMAAPAASGPGASSLPPPRCCLPAPAACCLPLLPAPHSCFLLPAPAASTPSSDKAVK